MSKQLFLREIVRRLRLKVHGFGVVEEMDNVVRGWIEIDIPRCGPEMAKEVDKFWGDEARTQYDAMETACSAAIYFLCTKRMVIVQDLNYVEVKRLEKKVFEAEQWASIFCGVLDSRKRYDEAMHREYEEFCFHAKCICKDFSDVLRVNISGFESVSVGSESIRAEYGGHRVLVSRVEEFASALVDLINTKTNMLASLNDLVWILFYCMYFFFWVLIQ